MKNWILSKIFSLFGVLTDKEPWKEDETKFELTVIGQQKFIDLVAKSFVSNPDPLPACTCKYFHKGYPDENTDCPRPICTQPEHHLYTGLSGGNYICWYCGKKITREQ